MRNTQVEILQATKTTFQREEGEEEQECRLTESG